MYMNVSCNPYQNDTSYVHSIQAACEVGIALRKHKILLEKGSKKMKKSLKKVILTCAAAAVLMSLSSVSAFAATFANDTVTLAETDVRPVTDADKQATVVVVPKDAVTYDENNIYYIDQAAGSATVFGTIKVPANMPDDDYVVRMGGEGATEIKEYGFTKGGGTITPEYKPGDVDGSGTVQQADSIAVLNHLAGNIPLTGDALARADVDGNESVQQADSIAILNHLAGNIPLF